ncbi:hypothetical protein [Domibacillus mangrovi]|uniref:Uncharacterized protein n=1 Tax=Domibacillus mangrovi TaxID=1714354 RepID=A0A1Q5NZD6_9BACI|nr:hypothetical protein [Domibacillus mangrovi]OKL35296.1 hypothetical protein BLL40_16235 [Domibacillus mangrovi]
MSKDHIKTFCIISILLIIAGFVLMFSSVSYGTSLGSSWLMKQSEGIADTSQYNMIVKTYINNFVIIGSISLITGLLLAMLTYFAPLFLRKNKG